MSRTSDTKLIIKPSISLSVTIHNNRIKLKKKINKKILKNKNQIIYVRSYVFHERL